MTNLPQRQRGAHLSLVEKVNVAQISNRFPICCIAGLPACGTSRLPRDRDISKPADWKSAIQRSAAQPAQPQPNLAKRRVRPACWRFRWWLETRKREQAPRTNASRNRQRLKNLLLLFRVPRAITMLYP